MTLDLESFFVVIQIQNLTACFGNVVYYFQKFFVVSKKKNITQINFWFYQDGYGNTVDEYNRESVLIGVDNEDYPLADTINLNNYLDFKPSKKPKTSKAPKKEITSSAELVNHYKSINNVKGHFFSLGLWNRSHCRRSRITTWHHPSNCV